MKLSSKVLIGSFLLLVLFAAVNFNFVAATPVDIENPDDTYQGQLQATTQYNFRFRLRTQLRINSTTDVDINIDCDALRIGVKEFELQVDAPHDLQMNMTCTEEQAELGLLKGNTYQIRNRNRYQYQEGFCIQIECNCTDPLYAQLRIRATNQNQVWAYYDEATEEWVSVPTTLQNGFLVAETTHFSTWTLLVPDYGLVIGISVGVGIAVVVAVVSMIYVRKRKRTSK